MGRSPRRSPHRSPHRSAGALSTESLYLSAKSSPALSFKDLPSPSTDLSNLSIADVSASAASLSTQEDQEDLCPTSDADAVAAVDTTVLRLLQISNFLPASYQPPIQPPTHPITALAATETVSI